MKRTHCRLYIRAGLWDQFPVRFVVLFSALLLCAHVSQAQQQERKLEDRIMRPDTTLGSREQNKSFGNYKTFQSAGSDRAAVRDFYFTQKYSPKSYQTKDFATKNHWAGDFKYATNEANTKGRYTIPNSAKGYETKPMEVKDARERGKNYAAGAYATDSFKADGKTQKILDAKYANQKPKTIDEVRDLLNKNN